MNLKSEKCKIFFFHKTLQFISRLDRFIDAKSKTFTIQTFHNFTGLRRLLSVYLFIRRVIFWVGYERRNESAKKVENKRAEILRNVT